MDMTLRWYGSKQDSVTLQQIRQIPGVTGVISALHEIPAGEPWPKADVLALKREIEAAGLKLLGIESINVHEDIKLGSSNRDQLIENYITSLESVGEADVHLVCYNFMPIFDWTRTDLAFPLPDGSTALAYDKQVIEEFVRRICLRGLRVQAVALFCRVGSRIARTKLKNYLENMRA